MRGIGNHGNFKFILHSIYQHVDNFTFIDMHILAEKKESILLSSL